MQMRRLGAVSVVVGLLAACGSTVQDTGIESGPATAADAGLNPAGAPSASQDGIVAPPAAGATGASPGQAVAGGTSPPASTGASPAAAGQSAPEPVAQGPTTGRGFTASEIYIGYLTWKDVSAAGGAIGYAVDYGDQEAIAKAVVKDINDRGGIAGRKVVPVFYDYNTSDVVTNPQQGDQAACSRLTEDRPVFAVVAVTGILSEALPACLAKHETPLIANTNIPYPKQFFEQWSPYFFSTASPMVERFVPVWLQGAAAGDYFSAWDTAAGAPGVAPVKVGILSSDSPAGELFTKLVTEELARQGREVAATYAVASAFDSNGMNSAVLQFRSEGVTHVVPDALNLLLFPQAAESQRYRPRYAISTASAPILVQSAAPAAQLAGARGVGYFPSYDVDNANDPGDVSPAAGSCRKIQQQGGQDTTQREAWNLMGKACDGFGFVAEAIARGGMSAEGIRLGAEAMQSMAPAGTFAITFGPGRADGPGAVRDLGFRDDCTCFAFLSQTNRPL